MQEFFYMDGKAFYVWTAYGITAIALIFSLVFAVRRKKVIAREIMEASED